jgi:CRP/FNR family cyclic AMP-dependent transcriptional regulator
MGIAMWIEVIGFAGSALAVLTYWMREMLPLRIVAVLAGICFLIYASALGSYPLILMEVTLLPINGYRLLELLRAGKAGQASPRIQGRRAA